MDFSIPWQWLNHKENFTKLKKRWLKNLVHKSKCAFKLFCNLFFMKLTMPNVCLSSTKPRTWVVAISTNFMYYKSLWLKMGDEKTLHQNLISGFKSFSSCKTTLKLCNMVILEKLDYNISVWPKSNIRTICPNSPTLQNTQKSGLQHT
jgi:hypothetical protein